MSEGNFDKLIVTGDVGIGTTDPQQKLTVVGPWNAGKDPDSGLASGGVMAIKSWAPQIDFIDTDYHDWAIHVNSGKMHFIHEPWEIALVLDDNGNVGIGTTNPEGGLHIANSGQQWGGYNYGTNIIVKGGGRHPAIGIFDHADANP